MIAAEWISWTSLAVVIAGFVSGILAAIVGVGGAVLTTPFIRFLGATPLSAVGSTVPAILPGALSGTIRYARAGLVEWRIAWTCGASGVLFAIVGALLAGVVNAGYLMIATATLVLWSGASLLGAARRDQARAVSKVSAEASAEDGVRDSLLNLIALGVFAGFLAGLLGIGGGLVLTPGLSVGVRLPMRRAIATSLVAVMLMSVTSLATHWYKGHIDWHFALPLAIGIVPGARLGSRITVAASDLTMRRVCGALFVVLGAVYLVREIIAL